MGRVEVLDMEKCTVGKKCGKLGKLSGLLSKKRVACAGAQCRVIGFLAVEIIPSS